MYSFQLIFDDSMKEIVKEWNANIAQDLELTLIGTTVLTGFLTKKCIFKVFLRLDIRNKCDLYGKVYIFSTSKLYFPLFAKIFLKFL